MLTLSPINRDSLQFKETAIRVDGTRVPVKRGQEKPRKEWNSTEQLTGKYHSAAVTVSFQFKTKARSYFGLKNIPTWKNRTSKYGIKGAEDESGRRKFAALKCVIWNGCTATCRTASSAFYVHFSSLSNSRVIALLQYKALRQKWRKALYRFGLNAAAFGCTSTFYLWVLSSGTVIGQLRPAAETYVDLKRKGGNHRILLRWEHGLGWESFCGKSAGILRTNAFAGSSPLSAVLLLCLQADGWRV